MPEGYAQHSVWVVGARNGDPLSGTGTPCYTPLSLCPAYRFLLKCPSLLSQKESETYLQKSRWLAHAGGGGWICVPAAYDTRWRSVQGQAELRPRPLLYPTRTYNASATTVTGLSEARPAILSASPFSAASLLAECRSARRRRGPSKGCAVTELAQYHGHVA